jgi:hypothetical protein
MSFQYHQQRSITLWILVIQTEQGTLLLSNGVHIIFQNFVFDDIVHLKASMRSSITYIHPFAMSLSAHLGSSNKNGVY